MWSQIRSLCIKTNLKERFIKIFTFLWINPKTDREPSFIFLTLLNYWKSNRWLLSVCSNKLLGNIENLRKEFLGSTRPSFFFTSPVFNSYYSKRNNTFFFFNILPNKFKFFIHFPITNPIEHIVICIWNIQKKVICFIYHLFNYNNIFYLLDCVLHAILSLVAVYKKKTKVFIDEQIEKLKLRLYT